MIHIRSTTFTGTPLLGHVTVVSDKLVNMVMLTENRSSIFQTDNLQNPKTELTQKMRLKINMRYFTQQRQPRDADILHERKKDRNRITK